MPKILVAYATIDGHTKKIAEFVARISIAQGFSVFIYDAKSKLPEPFPESYEMTIIAAPVHAGKYPLAIQRWVHGHSEKLNQLPSAFISVCLGVLENRIEANRKIAEIRQQFLHKSGWHPALMHDVAGAIPYTRYGILKKWVMKRIAHKFSSDTDTSRDHEYTDWGDLEEFTRFFIAKNLLLPSELKVGICRK